MDKIDVYTMMDFIVVEKYNGKIILGGSKLFCGCCGESLCTVTRDLTLPFGSEILIESAIDISFENGSPVSGLHHKTCGHLLFSFRKEWTFIPLEDFIDYQEKVKNKKT